MRDDDNPLGHRVEALLDAGAEFVSRFVAPYHRAKVRGIEHAPVGAALYVGNHSGGIMSMDSFLFGAAMWKARRDEGTPFGLAHAVVLSMPGIQQFARAIGAVPASPEMARRIFAAGKKALVYPGGDLDSLRPSRDRNRIVFGGRTGYVRVALENRVPIVPIVSAGSHGTFYVLPGGPWLARTLGTDRLFRIKTWPLVFTLPWGFVLGPPPPYFPWPAKVTIEVLAPIRFEREGPAAAADAEWVETCARTVEETMQAALDRLVAEQAAEQVAAVGQARYGRRPHPSMHEARQPSR